MTRGDERVSGSGGPVDPVAARRRLLAEGTLREQLRRQVDEQRDAEHLWEQRAELARERGRVDLAEQALARAAEHRERAGFLEAELIDQESAVEEARRSADQPDRSGVDPAQLLAAMDVDPAEAQLGTMERDAQLDRDLAELKATMGKGPAPAAGGEPPPSPEQPGTG